MIKKPKPMTARGRPTKEMEEAKEILATKRKMYKNLLCEADKLIEKGRTSEGRQCLQSLKELELDIEKMEKQLNPEPEQEEKEIKAKPLPNSEMMLNDPYACFRDLEVIEEEKTETVFKPKWLNEGTGELEDYNGQDGIRLRRRKIIG